MFAFRISLVFPAAFDSEPASDRVLFLAPLSNNKGEETRVSLSVFSAELGEF